VELLIVVALISLLCAMLVPSLSSVRRQALLAVCGTQMRAIGSAMAQYTSASSGQLPPFAFSDLAGDLALSGHWGGQSQPADPDNQFRVGMGEVNLWPLTTKGLLPPAQLLCPGAPAATRAGQESYFPYSYKFSTYCLRMPYSDDVLAEGPPAWQALGTLGVYAQAAGGRMFTHGVGRAVVPLVRLNRTYAERDPSTGVTRGVEVARAPMLSDEFIRQDWRMVVPPLAGGAAYPVRMGWCHDSWFNTLCLDGSVRSVNDDGTVRAATNPPGAALPPDATHNASAAVRVWRYFEDRR
jgi:type II secretory pathway pseudopilin PulG